MENAPYETVNVWMRQPNLNPRQLIPALLRYDHSRTGKEMTQVRLIGTYQTANRLLTALTEPSYPIPFLHCDITGQHRSSYSQPVAHFVCHWTHHRRDCIVNLPQKWSMSRKLLVACVYVKLTNIWKGREMHYNLDYALRLCSQNQRTQSCVHIYSQMGLYEEAVNLALKVGSRQWKITTIDPLADAVLSIMIWNSHVSMQINLKTTMLCERNFGSVLLVTSWKKIRILRRKSSIILKV